MARLAIVPARGGSRRVPRKNIRDFRGKPMMLHVLEAARDSQVFDEIHVSTDDREIREIAVARGFTPPFERPPELADEETPLIPVLQHVVEAYEAIGRHFDTVGLLYATAALIEASDLQKACQAFECGDRFKPLISVCKYPTPIEWAFRLAEDKALIPVSPGMFALASNDIEDGYYDCAAFIYFNCANLMSLTGAGTDQNYRAYVLPRDKAVDIDTLEDWEFAEQLFAGRRTDNGKR